MQTPTTSQNLISRNPLEPLIARIGAYVIFLLAGCAIYSQLPLAIPNIWILYGVPVVCLFFGHFFLKVVERAEAHQKRDKDVAVPVDILPKTANVEVKSQPTDKI